MNKMTFLKELENNFAGFKKQFDAYDQTHKVDPRGIALLQKIEESICEFHKPEMELVESCDGQNT